MYLCNNVLVCYGKYIRELMSPWSRSRVTPKESKEKCHFLEVGRRACVQELEASQWGWRADNKKEMMTGYGQKRRVSPGRQVTA